MSLSQRWNACITAQTTRNTSTAYITLLGRSVVSPIFSPPDSESNPPRKALRLPNGAASASRPSTITPTRSTAESSTPACSTRDSLSPVVNTMVCPARLLGASAQVARSSANLSSSETAISTTAPQTSCWATNSAKLR